MTADEMLGRDGDIDPDAELVVQMGLPLAYAFNIGRVQRANLAPRPTAVPWQDALSEVKRFDEGLAQLGIAGGLAVDVADDATEISPECFQAVAGPIERLIHV